MPKLSHFRQGKWLSGKELKRIIGEMGRANDPDFSSAGIPTIQQA